MIRLLSTSLFALLLSVHFASAADKVFRVGVLPVHDRTRDVFREAYGDNLRRFLLEELVELGLQPVFLNTGPSFDHADQELIRDLAREAKTEAVLATQLVAVVSKSSWKDFQAGLPTDGLAIDGTTASARVQAENVASAEIPKLVSRGDAVLVVEAALAPVSDLTSRHVFFVSADIRRSFFKELADLDAPGSSSRRFRDTATGRAALMAAREIAGQLNSLLAASDIQPTGIQPKPGGVCSLTFTVRFSDGRGSRNYTLAINGKELTHTLRNGRAKLEVPGGLFQARITVQDAPYGLGIQPAYDANSFIDCPDRPKTAILEIGAVGEATLRWEDQ